MSSLQHFLIQTCLQDNTKQLTQLSGALAGGKDAGRLAC